MTEDAKLPSEFGAFINAFANALKETAHHQVEDQIEYPIQVDEAILETGTTFGPSPRAKMGDYVAVRPADERCEGKTFLGFFLGNTVHDVIRSYDPEKKRLVIQSLRNPAMFVPDLGRVVWGMGSWWHVIDTPEKLEAITDKTIDDVWYVKALKALQEAAKDEA